MVAFAVPSIYIYDWVFVVIFPDQVVQTRVKYGVLKSSMLAHMPVTLLGLGVDSRSQVSTATRMSGRIPVRLRPITHELYGFSFSVRDGFINSQSLGLRAVSYVEHYCRARAENVPWRQNLRGVRYVPVTTWETSGCICFLACRSSPLRWVSGG